MSTCSVTFMFTMTEGFKVSLPNLFIVAHYSQKSGYQSQLSFYLNVLYHLWAIIPWNTVNWIIFLYFIILFVTEHWAVNGADLQHATNIIRLISSICSLMLQNAIFYLTIFQCVALKMGGYALASVSKIISKLSETLLFTFYASTWLWFAANMMLLHQNCIG